MITIKIPNSFFNERKYIFEYLFKNIYKTDYFITSYDENNDSKGLCTIVLNNGNKIFIEDHFFNKFKDNDLSKNEDINKKYIKVENIPKRLVLCKNEFTFDDNIPLIYGENEIISSPTQIISKIDIISSLFFLLSRWEEIAIKKRDEHNRFSEIDSLLFRNNLLNRPVANEYIELLWNMIFKLDPGTKNGRGEREFKISLSHDIDEFRKYHTKLQIIKKLTGDLVRRFSIKDFFSDLLDIILIKFGNRTDPYFKFDSLMNLSEEVDSKAIFFFKTGGKSIFDRNKYDVNTDEEVKTVMNEIVDRGHEIAIHYSYLALLDKDGNEQKKISFIRDEKFDLEKANLELLSTKDKDSSINNRLIKTERSHYLRFNIETSFNKLEKIGITNDHSMGFSTENGFRVGLCYEYPLWNFEKREKFKDLMEYPLILMDTVMIEAKNLTQVEQIHEIQYYYDIVKKYNGNFTFLIHNSTDKKFLNLVYDVIKIEDRRKNERR